MVDDSDSSTDDFLRILSYPGRVRGGVCSRMEGLVHAVWGNTIQPMLQTNIIVSLKRSL
jgi:hypothetical protein